MFLAALRRSHMAALVILVALLLLLLARLPSSYSQPQPILLSLRFGTEPSNVNRTSSDNLPLSSYSSSSSMSVSSSVPVERTTKSKAIWTRDLYVAGHQWSHPELCPSLGAGVHVLILITSAPSHTTARDGIRLTWGHYARRADLSIAFVTGTPPLALLPALAAENRLYGDIIMGKFIDSYANLTLKTISMLEWVDTYCPRTLRVLKTDDDMFINVPKLLQFISAPVRVNMSGTIWGKVVKKWTPKRSKKSKYYVSPTQYPSEIFPNFATGPAYLMTGDVVGPLLAAAMQEPFLNLEDVFVTGVLASRLGIKRIHAPEFYNKKVSPHPCAIQRGIAIHMVRYHEQFDMWRKLLDGKSKCAR